MNPFVFIDGYKTYLASVGLFGLALYQFSQGQYDVAFQSLMAALTAFGIKSALTKQDEEVKVLKMSLARRFNHADDVTLEEKV